MVPIPSRPLMTTVEVELIYILIADRCNVFAAIFKAFELYYRVGGGGGRIRVKPWLYLGLVWTECVQLK